MLGWIVEIGLLDTTIAAHMVMHREDKLYAIFHIFAYLKQRHNCRSIFDPTCQSINLNNFKASEDWTPFYGYVKEAIPVNAPTPQGMALVLQNFVDADHAGNLVTRQSRSGYVQLVYMPVIDWYSKKQGSVADASLLAVNLLPEKYLKTEIYFTLYFSI